MIPPSSPVPVYLGLAVVLGLSLMLARRLDRRDAKRNSDPPPLIHPDSEL